MQVLVSWSGGKDSALALADVLRRREFRVAGLLTTFNVPLDRVSMHGVRRELVRAQADSLRLPLDEVDVPVAAHASAFTAFPPNETYEAALLKTLERARRDGIEGVVFGDVHLSDVREYRDALLARAGLTALYPLWDVPREELLEDFLEEGYEAVVVCVDERRLDADFLGDALGADFLAALPAGVDPWGERGEYHSFVVDAPHFRHAVPFRFGARGTQEPFAFQDLHLVEIDEIEEAPRTI